MMSVQEAYETVNGILTYLDEETIPLPGEGSDTEKLQHLIDRYITLLREKNPKYKEISNPRVIPDMVLQGLFETLDTTNA